MRYVALYFVPIGLSADTDLRLFASSANPRTVAGFALFLASVVGMWRASRTPGWGVVAFGLAWFWIGIAPTSTVIPLAEVTNVADPSLDISA